MLWPSSTDSSFLAIGAQCKPLLLGSSTAGHSWRIILSSLFFPWLWRGIYFAFDSDHKQLYFHLWQLFSESEATSSSSVFAVQNRYGVCWCSGKFTFTGDSGAGISYSPWPALKISFMLFCVCVRKEGVFTGIEITHFTRVGPDTESRELFRHPFPAF